MKRVPPSVRMKEDVDRLLQGEGRDEAVSPMDGFVRGTAQFRRKWQSRRKRPRFSVGTTTGEARGSVPAGEMTMSRRRCRLRQVS
jgi:hypothetical protein